MILEWLIYCLLISTLLAVAAWVGESSLRAQGWPGRWVWVAALLGSVLLPAATWLLPQGPQPATALPALPGAYVMESLPPLSFAPTAARGPTTEDLALMGWAVVSGGLLLWLGVAVLRVWRLGRRWDRRRVDGVDVLVSRSTGPAAMGVVRGRVVVPEWALSLDGGRRRLLLMHEAEHVRARDPGLAFGGLVLCALMPWNLPIWWQLARLRLAIEMDCDQRVLRRSGDIRGYGTLLLEVGQRRARFAVGLAESKSSLERRIRMITERGRGRRRVRALGLATMSGLVLAVACETPGPTELGVPEPGEVGLDSGFLAEALGSTCPPTVFVDGERVQEGDLPQESDIASVEVIKGGVLREGYECGVILVSTKGATPDDAARDRRTREELVVRSMVQRRQDASDFMVDGTPPRFRIDAVRRAMADASCPLGVVVDGVIVTDPSLLEGVGSDGLRSVEVASPAAGVGGEAARVQGRRFCRVLWIRTTNSEDVPDLAEATRDTPVDLSAAPTFTPMTVRPQLRNADEVRDALERHYPPLLRDAGIEGSVNMWFFIDEEGVVRKTRVNQSSDHPALDQAAQRVASLMEFTPAYNRDTRVPVWVALDIAFRQERTPARSELRRRETVEREAAAVRERGDREAAPGGAIQDAPHFTPMTQRPELANQAEIARALKDHYPPLLRDAGIGGSANVWFYIDETGRTVRTMLNESSGYEAFDQAALRVAELMEWVPAENNGTPVPVWVALDIRFTSN